ncbi:hypothetical protein PMG11_03488 [Penicillium brasilianum]|uniref:Uncharacterized protein n=1 Tax=Penicillium brasilianum TaxID=104259 RepID=A0A0F7VDR7_PENBI|nr:hypothetical protein PMG11_03488 [Penicillium brasilianum]
MALWLHQDDDGGRPSGAMEIIHGIRLWGKLWFASRRISRCLHRLFYPSHNYSCCHSLRGTCNYLGVPVFLNSRDRPRNRESFLSDPIHFIPPFCACCSLLVCLKHSKLQPADSVLPNLPSSNRASSLFSQSIFGLIDLTHTERAIDFDCPLSSILRTVGDSLRHRFAGYSSKFHPTLDKRRRHFWNARVSRHLLVSLAV